MTRMVAPPRARRAAGSINGGRAATGSSISQRGRSTKLKGTRCRFRGSQRQVNDNFDYDYEAYEAVKRDFGKLIDQGHLRDTMELSQELMTQGSYQVEMSDEGMMTEDIAECLRVVIKALKKSGLPSDEVKAWCDAMHKQDRVGFICDSELRTLRDKYRSTG
jgi:hypothetical protein